MSYTVIIAEKPSVASSIAKVVGATTPHRDKACGYLVGNGYRVTWAFGHLVGLCTPEQMGFTEGQLPMFPEKWETRIIEGQNKEMNAAVAKQMKTIETLFNGADRIIVATDAGREGELIFRYIYEYLGCTTPFDRLWISSLTDEAITKGLGALRPGKEMNALNRAAHARSEADWLVGFNASRALRLASGYKGNLSLGRVQTPVLCMICSRYEENKNFKPTPFWQLTALVHKDMINFPVITENKYPTEELALTALSAVRKDGQFHIKEVETKDVSSRPPLLYDLTALQRAANSRLGMTAEETLKTAQSLYEKKYLSYPRTGSRYIPEDVFKIIPSLIAKVSSYPKETFRQAADELRGSRLCRRSVDDTKVTDHHALLPTEVIPTDLSGREKDIWEMVCGRLLEAFGQDSIAKRTNVTLECASITFKTSGSVPVKAGWKAVFGTAQDDQEEKRPKDSGKETEEGADEEFNAGTLPPLSQGEVLPGANAEAVRKTDKPLPIYTDSSLLGEMETCGKRIEDEEIRESMKEIGLGTPATRAATIEILIRRGYVVREGKKLLPTELGSAIAAAVSGRKISDVRTTGEWERELSRIEQGQADKASFDKAIRQYSEEIIEDIRKNVGCLDGLSRGGGQTRTCPLCGKPMKNRKYDVFCDDSQGGCGLHIPLEVAGKKLPESALTALCQGKKTSTLKGFKSKTGKSFEASLKVNPETHKVEFLFEDRPKTPLMQGRICPCCGKTLTDDNWKLSCECGLVLYKTVAGAPLTENEIDALLSGKKVPKTGLKSKDGKKFSASLYLDKERRKIAFSSTIKK